jgi:hypothetical protein
VTITYFVVEPNDPNNWPVGHAFIIKDERGMIVSSSFGYATVGEAVDIAQASVRRFKSR